MLDKKSSSHSSTSHSTADEIQLQAMETDSSSASGGEKILLRNCSFGYTHNNLATSRPRSTCVVPSQDVNVKTEEMTAFNNTPQTVSLLSDRVRTYDEAEDNANKQDKMTKICGTLNHSNDSLGEDEHLISYPVFKESFDDLPIIPGFNSDMDDDFYEKSNSKEEIGGSPQSFDFFDIRIGHSTDATIYDSDKRRAINTTKKTEEEKISDEYKSVVGHPDLLSSMSYQELASGTGLPCSNAPKLLENEFSDTAASMATWKESEIMNFGSTNSAVDLSASSGLEFPNQGCLRELPNCMKAIGLNRSLGQHSLQSELAQKNNNQTFDNDNNILGLNCENELGEDKYMPESQDKLGDDGETPSSGSDSEDEEADEKEDEEYETVWVAPDGGWGWLVLFGSILVNILIPGTVKSFGVLFIEFLEVFKTSPSAAAWIPAISYFLYSSTGPFAGALAIRFSHRVVTIIGGLLASTGLALSYFATSIGFLYVSYGVIGGLGAGLAYPIGVFIVGQYFDKKRGLANGLCTSGSALGSVLVPPFLRFLLEEYGYRYAVLIMGVLLLNVCLAALFYDPVEKHLKKKLIPKKATTSPNSCTENTQTPGSSPSRTQGIDIQKISNREREIMASLPIAIPRVDSRDIRDRRNSSGVRRATFQIGQDTPQGEDSWSLRSSDLTSPLAVRLLRDENGELPNSPKANSRPRSRGGVQGSLESDSDILFTGSHYVNGSGAISTQPSNGASRSKINLSAIPEDEDGISDTASRRADWNFYKGLPSSRQRLIKLSLEQGNQLVGQNPGGGSLPASGTQTGLARTMSIASNVSNSSFHYVSTIHHGSTLMAMQYDKQLPEFASTFTLKSAGDSCWTCLYSFPKKCLQKMGLCKKRKRDVEDGLPVEAKSSWNLFDLKLLKDGFFIIMLLSTSMSAVGYTNFLILLPAYALGMGFDKSKASLLLSYVAAFDFVGRIGGAALSDLKFIPRVWFFVLGLLGSGIALAFLPFATEYWTLSIFCGIFGLFSGTYIGVTAVILADKLGPENLGSSYGITLFLNGILQFIGPPICGAAYEALGKYEPIFIALGIILIFGASLWSFVPAIENQKAIKRLREQKAERIRSQAPNQQNYASRNEDESLVV